MSFLACSINSIRSRCLEVLYRPTKSLLILLLIRLSSITMCRGRDSGYQKDFFSSSFPPLSSPVYRPLRVSSHLPTIAPVADCSCLLLDAYWWVAEGGSVVLCCSVSAPALGRCWSPCLGSWVFSNKQRPTGGVQLLPWEFRLSSLPFLQL